MSKDTGGSAFPTSVHPDSKDGQSMSGMTLRDYFAVHSEQPGVLEIVTAAGFRCEDNFWVIQDDGVKIKFTYWYEAMSQAVRFALHAKVRFQQADAMLEARKQEGGA